MPPCQGGFPAAIPGGSHVDEVAITNAHPTLRAWLPAALTAAVLLALLAWNHHLQQRLDTIASRATTEPVTPEPRTGWNMHMMGNLETFLDVNPIGPEAARQLQALTAESMQESALIQRCFDAGSIDCFERLVATKRLLERHEAQAAALLEPEQIEDYLDIVCPSGQRGCLAYDLRGLDLVTLLER
jgi:hypothetical protein